MILSYIPLLFYILDSVSPVTSSDNYQYQVRLDMGVTLDTCICQVPNNDVYSIDTYFMLQDCRLYFNSADDYRININDITFADYVYKNGDYKRLDSHTYSYGLRMINGNTETLSLTEVYRFFDYDDLCFVTQVKLNDVVEYEHRNYDDFSGIYASSWNLSFYYEFTTSGLDEFVKNTINSYFSYSEEDVNTAKAEGYAEGYADGYVNGVSTDSTVFTIFNGILNVALIPINFFLAIFNFEILGINVASFVSALLSVCVVIIVCRVVLNGGTGSGDSKE